MSFSWQDFLDRRSISYSTKGASGDNVRIRCPWCGDAQGAASMSVSLVGDGWRCWRQPGEHYGKSPARLVQALINCSWQEACRITGQPAGISGDDVLSKVNSLFKKPEGAARKLPLIMPPEFQSFRHELPSSQLFYDYLVTKRGFARTTVRALTETYGIHYCMRGPFHGRIIFPILHDAEMVNWTGRSIYPVEELRYLSLSTDPENAKEKGLPPAVKPITEYLWRYDQLKTTDATCLVLTEGPFDALKVSVLGAPRWIESTCFFTMTASPTQIELLHEVLPRFKHRILLLDQNTTASGLRLSFQLQPLGVVLRHLPSRFKDPGELQSYDDLSCVLNLGALQRA